MSLKSKMFMYRLYREFGNGIAASVVKAIGTWLGIRVRLYPRSKPFNPNAP